MENHVKIYFMVLYDQVLNALKCKIISKSLIALCNQVLICPRAETHAKIFFIVLCNEVLSCLLKKNYFEMSFIVLCNQLLNHLQVGNHVKSLSKYSATMF